MRFLILFIFGLSALLADALITDEEANINASKAYKLAQMYENGDGIEKNMENSFYWYKKAAELSMKSGKEENNDILLKNAVVENKKELENALISEYTPSVQASARRVLEYKNYFYQYLDDYEDNETRDTVLQVVTSSFGLLPYHMTYFMPATYDFKSQGDKRKHTETVFQISLKKDIATNIFGLDETFGFGYTQRSWWQTTEESAPFRETNYIPEVFAFFPLKGGIETLKGVKMGFMHESNGRDGKESRSWNRVYVEGYFQYSGIFFLPRVWYVVNEDKEHNSDIVDYLGYGDLNIILPYKKHLVKLMLRNNFDISENRGAVQLDWTFPIGKHGLFAYVQFFSGHGESLADYNDKTRRVGIGVAFSR